MKKNYVIYLLLLITVFICESSFARSNELIDPAPITFSQPVAIEKIEGAVYAAITTHGWTQNTPTITESDSNSIDIVYTIRTHKIIAKLVFDTSSVKLHYINSENMKYKQQKNKTFIHPNYMVWTQELMDGIDRNIKNGTTAAQKQSNVPTEPFKNFDSFTLHTVTLSELYRSTEGNRTSTANLDFNLKNNLIPILDSKKREGNRNLDIKINVEGIRFIGTGARIMIGAMAGRSWIVVKIEFIESSTNQTIGIAKLYRVANKANGFTASRNDYAMIEDIARDIIDFIHANYENAVGGGTPVPANIESDINNQ